MPTEIIVPLENKPGTLAKVAEVLAAARVNLQGIGYASGARGVLRVIANDTGKALAVLKASKFKVRQAASCASNASARSRKERCIANGVRQASVCQIREPRNDLHRQ